MTELLPCPFCGGEARFETYGGTACAVVCQACGCGTPTMRLDDGMIAVDLWNRRAERTCRLVECPPSTCARKEGWATWPVCSGCGGAVRRNDRYCSHCGALVIGYEDGD